MNTRTVAQQLKTALNGRQTPRALDILKSLTHDEILPTLIVVFDEVVPAKRVAFIKSLDPALVSDVEVMSELDLEAYILEDM